MDPLSLSSGYLPFSTLLQRNPSFFWVRSQFWKFLGNNSGNIGPIKLKLWPQLLLICIYLPYYAFKKVKFLRPQDVLKDCFLGSTFAPIYPMKKSKIEKVSTFQENIYPSGYPNIQKSEPLWSQFWIKNTITFCRISFLANMDPKVKDQEIRGQVSTTFWKPLNVV